MSRSRPAFALARIATAPLLAAFLAPPLLAQCNPHGTWQGVAAAPSIPGTPIGPSDVLGIPAVLFAGAIAGSPAPFYLWDGLVEHPLAAGPGRTIYFASGAIPFESPSGPVIAVRGFFEIGGVATVLAFWDGTDWQLPGVAVQGVLHALAVLPGASGDELWIGGEVSVVGGTIYAGGIARYRASGWDEPAQVTGIVERMLVAPEPGGGDLFLAGFIVAVDGVPFDKIARFDGFAWQSLGAGTVSEIEALSLIDGPLGPELWVSGDLDQSGPIPVADLARWRGGAWEALPPPADPGYPSFFVPTEFIVVPTELGDRIAPLVVLPIALVYFGVRAWDDSGGAWVELTANPNGAVHLAGSPLLPDGVYRGSATSPNLQHWCHGPEYPFVRGDINGDGAFDLADPIRLLEIQFQGVTMPNCSARFDANHDGDLDLSDTVFLLGALFPPVQGMQNSLFPPTLPNCGLDPDPVGLYCLEPQSGC
jgi:hypothetical protein